MTLDHLPGGRLVLAVGLGALDDGGFTKVGEPTDRKIRARLLLLPLAGVFKDLEDLLDQRFAFVWGEVAGVDGLFI